MQNFSFYSIKGIFESIFVNLSTKNIAKKIIDVDDDVIDNTTSKEFI